jgi:MFS family permease
MQPENSATRSEVDALYRKVFWRTIPILIISYIIAFVDRGNVGFAKLQFMSDLGFTEAVFGLGGGLFYLGYSVFEIPSNLLLAKTGARLTLLRIMVLWGACSAALALMSTPAHFYVLRSLLGAAEAGFFPGVLFYLTTWIPASRRARFTAMFMSAIGISGVISGPVSGAIMQGLEGVAGLRGWQWMFITEGIPACLMGVIVYLFLADRPSTAKWLSPREREIVEAELASEATDKKVERHASFLGALTDLRVYSLVAMSIRYFAVAADHRQTVGCRQCLVYRPSLGHSVGSRYHWTAALGQAFRPDRRTALARRNSCISDRLGVDCPSLGEFECGAIPSDAYGDDDRLSLRDRPVLDDAGALSVGLGCGWRHRSDHDCGKYCSLLRPDDCRLGVLHDRIALSRSVFLWWPHDARRCDYACRNADAFDP